MAVQKPRKPEYPVRENASKHARFFDGSKDLCRHEDAASVDLSRLVAQFGGGTVPLSSSLVSRSPVSSVVDYDMDLMSAIQAVDALRSSFLALDPAVQQGFPSWQAIADGLRDGLLVEVDGKPVLASSVKKVPEPSSGSSGDGSGASAKAKPAPVSAEDFEAFKEFRAMRGAADGHA